MIRESKKHYQNKKRESKKEQTQSRKFVKILFINKNQLNNVAYYTNSLKFYWYEPIMFFSRKYFIMQNYINYF